MKRSPLKRKTPLRAKRLTRKRKKKSDLQKRKDKQDSQYWNNKCHAAVTEFAHKSSCIICGRVEGEVALVAGHHLIRKSKSRLLRWHPMNIVPLCEEHHMQSVKCAAHSENVLAVAAFVEYLKENYPRRHAWLEENADAIRQTDMRGPIEKPNWRYQYTIWTDRTEKLDKGI